MCAQREVRPLAMKTICVVHLFIFELSFNVQNDIPTAKTSLCVRWVRLRGSISESSTKSRGSRRCDDNDPCSLMLRCA